MKVYSRECLNFKCKARFETTNKSKRHCSERCEANRKQRRYTRKNREARRAIRLIEKGKG
jgi:hypothetical protein